MSQSNSGTIYYYNQQVYDRDKELQTNEVEKMHLPAPAVPYAVDYYEHLLSMTEEDLNKLTIEECAKYEYILSSYAFFIKRAANQENSRISYLKHKVNSIISQIATDKNQDWTMRRYSAIASNEAAKKFQEDLVVAEQKYARLQDLHFGINNIADKIGNLRFIKQQELKDGA